jgi:uncharacterized Zn finger protein
MTITKELHPLQWSDLPDIDDVAPISEEDEACLQEIKAVLEKHGRLSRFGIALLHSHFYVNTDEVMVESCDINNRTLVVQPVKRDEFKGRNTIETLWRFDLQGVNFACHYQCFINSNKLHVSRHEAFPPD